MWFFKSDLSRVLGVVWVVLCIGCLSLGCGAGVSDPDTDNPFLDDHETGAKSDTGWVSSPYAVEVEVVLESRIHTPGIWQAVTGPADLSQFALTNLRLQKNNKLFIESQMVIPEQSRPIQWWLDGQWVDAIDVDVYNTPLDKLNHFRITGVNAVAYKPDQPEQLLGQVFEASVPLYPYDLYGTAGETCASAGSHSLYDETYWYFWNPMRSECQLETTTMTATVTDLVKHEGPRYPEYDQLIRDGRVEAVVFFGAFGGVSDMEQDKGYKSMLSFVRKMELAGFEQSTSPDGLARFSKHEGGLELVVDVSSPLDFEGLGDYKNAPTFDRAVKSHEIIVYNGHSIMGTSNFWNREGIYPDTYQVFLFNGCLGYEYYVRAILEGKGGWDKADVISNIMETPANPQPKVIASFLAAIFQGSTEAGSVSYAEILKAIYRYTYNSCYGISGARDNCYSPQGSLCQEPEPEHGSYLNDEPKDIPDGSEAGVSSTIHIPHSKTLSEIDIGLDLEHTWLGDLHITLEHHGVELVLRDRQDDMYSTTIKTTITSAAFSGLDVGGDWVLTVSDHETLDLGKLNSWSLTY